MNKNQKIYNIRSAMLHNNLDISTSDIEILRRCAMTLHRWCEGECGNSDHLKSWCIVRDETTGKPYQEVHLHTGNGSHKFKIPDREAGALKRIKAICKEYNCHYYYQTDPRGCSLYVSMEPLTDQNYSSRGFAVGDYY